MVKPVVDGGILYAHNIPYALNYAYKLSVAARGGADWTGIGIGDHIASGAIPHLTPEIHNGSPQPLHILLRQLQQVKGKTERAPSAHARQRRELLHCILQQLRRELLLGECHL